MSYPGCFVTLEGGEGAGKTTHLNTIKAYLSEQNIPYITTREPGGTPLGDQVRSMLLEQHSLAITPVAQTLLLFAARAQHIADVIEPALTRGTWVVCDRFTDATRAYQGGGHQVNAKRIEALADWVHKDLNPDVTFIFDVRVSVGESRLGDKAVDRFETEATQFKQRVRDAYQRIQQQDPQRVHLVSAEQDLAAVTEEVARLMREFMDRV